MQRNQAAAQTAHGSRGGALPGIVGARLVYEIEKAHGTRPGLIIERNPIIDATTRSGAHVLTGIGGKGAPDLYLEVAAPGGVRCALWVECKAGMGELNPDQRLFHARARRQQRLVILARSVDDVTRALDLIEAGRASEVEVSHG